jgi:hypothetical protein
LAAVNLKKNATAYEKRKAKTRFRRRAAIEPKRSKLKSDFRWGRNFLKGQVGDAINVFFAAAASNLSFWMRQVFLRLFQQSKIKRENVGLSGHPFQREGFSGQTRYKRLHPNEKCF